MSETFIAQVITEVFLFYDFDRGTGKYDNVGKIVSGLFINRLQSGKIQDIIEEGSAVTGAEYLEKKYYKPRKFRTGKKKTYTVQKETSQMRKEKHTKRRLLPGVILTVIAAAVLLSAVTVGMCLFNERPAVQTVDTYRNAYCDTVINIAGDGGAEILPKNTAADTGIIFYTGAQITPDAYIPLLSRLAQQGYPCFIPALTFNMAALEPKAADDIISAHPEIGSWILAGHSMGGLTASGYADDHRDTVDGLILIAAYTNRDMSDASLPVLSVFGDTDSVMNKALYDKRLAWNPAGFEEHIIPGANHAQFGDYGKQPRDNEAAISAGEQQSQTAGIILDWLSRRTEDKKNREQ